MLCQYRNKYLPKKFPICIRNLSLLLFFHFFTFCRNLQLIEYITTGRHFLNTAGTDPDRLGHIPNLSNVLQHQIIIYINLVKNKNNNKKKRSRSDFLKNRLKNFRGKREL